MAVAKGDYEQCKTVARQFLKTAEWCFGDGLIDLIGGNIYPFAVNASFACEAFIKAIMIRNSNNGEFITGHNLNALFKELDPEIKESIKTIFNSHFSVLSLEQFLEKDNKCFEDWRYTFENTGEARRVNPHGLMAFAKSLDEYVSKFEVTE